MDQIAEIRAQGYQPRRIFQESSALQEVFDLLQGDYFNPSEPGIYRPITDSLLGADYFMLLADFESYRAANEQLDRAYSDTNRWTRMALANIARVGHFSSDRTIREYNEEIWRARPYDIELG